MARILIIDRDKPFEVLIGEWLENEGHEIRVDPDLDTGFETIQEVEPDLVIICLPEPETDSTQAVVEEYLARSVSYKVMITKTVLEGAPAETGTGTASGEEPFFGTEKDLLPAKYKDANQSGLTAEVKDGPAIQLKFDLTD